MINGELIVDNFARRWWSVNGNRDCDRRFTGYCYQP
nr:MAG TPA: hypothetical protein [Caudoviricetes sp.]